MPGLLVVVAGVAAVDRPVGPMASEPTVVRFDDGQTAALDPSDALAPFYADALDDLAREGRPAYAEIEPGTRRMLRLLIPSIDRVSSVVTMPDGTVEVELELSHARHFVQHGNPDRDRLRDALEAAWRSGARVAVAEEDDAGIVDVRPVPGRLAGPAEAELSDAPPAADLAARAVSPRRARELFELVAARSCDPQKAQAPCIPFLYARDGCWVRAHEMCRLLKREGASHGKLWIYGDLRPDTRNHPLCRATWRYHVAPVLAVAAGSADELRVLDPSLFSEPRSPAGWKAIQNDPRAEVARTGAGVYYRSRAGSVRTDTSFERTTKLLAFYRIKLKEQTAKHGWPPCKRPALADAEPAAGDAAHRPRAS